MASNQKLDIYHKFKKTMNFLFIRKNQRFPYKVCFRTILNAFTIFHLKQDGTGSSRRHIQGSKIAKRLPSVKYSFTVLENRKFHEKKFFEKITYSKKWTEWPATASFWRAEGGTLPKLSTFLSPLKADPFGEKTNFRKKSHNAEKLEGALGL